MPNHTIFEIVFTTVSSTSVVPNILKVSLAGVHDSDFKPRNMSDSLPVVNTNFIRIHRWTSTLAFLLMPLVKPRVTAVKSCRGGQCRRSKSSTRNHNDNTENGDTHIIVLVKPSAGAGEAGADKASVYMSCPSCKWAITNEVCRIVL